MVVMMNVKACKVTREIICSATKMQFNFVTLSYKVRSKDGDLFNFV